MSVHSFLLVARRSSLINQFAQQTVESPTPTRREYRSRHVRCATKTRDLFPNHPQTYSSLFPNMLQKGNRDLKSGQRAGGQRKGD